MTSGDIMPPDPGLPPTDASEPAVDTYGQPVQPASKTPAYLLLAGVLICAVGSAGLAVADYFQRNVGLAGIGMGLGALPIVGVLVATLKVPHLREILGPLGWRVLAAGTILGVLVAVALLGIVDPNSAND